MASQSLLDLLDDSMIAQIASVLIAPLNARIRAICPRMRDVIARDPAQKIVKTTAEDLFHEGATRGSRCLCALAFDHIDRADISNVLCDALWKCFTPGNCEMCAIVREFSLVIPRGDPLRFGNLFESAACHGDFETSALAMRFIIEDIQSGASPIEQPMVFDQFLTCLAGLPPGRLFDKPGYHRAPGLTKEECRQLAVSLQSCAASIGITIGFNGLLPWAAYLGRDDLCELVVELGDPATLQLDWMLAGAIKGEESGSCERSSYEAIAALHAKMIQSRGAL